MATASSLGLPRPFGPYELVRQLAVGGMAEVFVARARSVAGFEKVVALKTIHPRFSEDPEFARLLVEEANITAQLSHRNIVQVIDLGQIDDTHYIAMEYVDGMDLSRLLSKMRERSQRCSPRFAAFIVREVCDGLEHAHRKSGSDGKPLKIIHRDVSPPNILISSAGEVKLTDFGIAKAALRASSTEAGVVKGKYAYMPPEQAKGQPLDVRADVFSAGCVLYELATGSPVYKDAPLPALLDRVSRGIFDAPEKVRPDLPAPLVAVIKKALAPNAADRYASARAMADDLNAFLYTLPPNPEFEVSQIVSGIQEGSRASIPPMAGMSLFDDDSEESTQIESMAAMRSKMTPGEAAAKPAASTPMKTAPDPDAFTDEPTRAMRRDKLIPDAPPDDDDEPEPTAVGVRPNTAAPRVMGSSASNPAMRPAAGAAPVGRPAPAPPAAPSATSSSKPVTTKMPTAGPRPQPTANPPGATASAEPRLPARKATLIGAVAPVLPDRAPPSAPTPPSPPAQRRSMPPPPPPAATKSTMNMPALPQGGGPPRVPSNTRPPTFPAAGPAPLPAQSAGTRPAPAMRPPPASAPQPQQPPSMQSSQMQAQQPPAMQQAPMQQPPPMQQAQAPMQSAPMQQPQGGNAFPSAFQQPQQQPPQGNFGSAPPQQPPPGNFGNPQQQQPQQPQGFGSPPPANFGAPQQAAPYGGGGPPSGNFASAQQGHPYGVAAASEEDRKQRRAVIVAGVFAAVGVVALVSVLFLGR